MVHFTMAELTRSSTAAEHGIANTPEAREWAALVRLVEQVLDPLREHLGVPVHVTSGYRCDRVNALVGSSPRSQHPRGEAADIRVDGMTGRELAAVIVGLGLPADQLIYYDPAPGKPAVHVSHRYAGEQRGQVLHWRLTGYIEEPP